MQIIYVLGIITLALYSIFEVEMSSNSRALAKALMNQKNLDVKFQQQLKQAARKAFDFGLDGSGCPTGTVKISNIGTAAIPLCWGTEIDQGCFTNIEFQGRNVCFAINQNSLVMNTTQKSLLAFILQSHKAMASTRAPEAWADTTHGVGNDNMNPSPSFAAGWGASASASVILPANSGLGIKTNHIDCTQGHTECFTIIYCLNGSRVCSGSDRQVNTYAIRRF